MTSRRRRGSVVLVAAGLIACFALPSAAVSTDAAWVDIERATSSALTAGTVSPVTQLTCTPGVGSARFSWTSPTGGLTRASYRWTVAGAVTGSGTLASTATSVTLSSGLLGLGTGTFSIYAVGPSGWESAPVQGTVTVVLGLLWGCSVP